MRTPLPYYGAKVSMAKRIVRELPEKHEVYLEPFCGSAAVFFEKPPAEAVEILSDMNPWCLAALRAVRDTPWSFHDALPDEIEHDHWRNSVIAVRNNRITGSDIEDGVNMFLAWQSAFNSSPWSGARSKRACQQYADSRGKGLVWQRIEAGFERLNAGSGTLVEQTDAISGIRREAAPGVLIFCDPPYMKMEEGGGSRGAAYGGYGPWEPDMLWHQEFLDAIDEADRAGAMIAMTTGRDGIYEERLAAADFVLTGSMGMGRGAGRGGHAPGMGGAAKAEHCIWVNQALLEARL